MAELFRGALIEDPAQGTHGLIGLVVLLVVILHLLAHRGAWLAAGVLPAGHDCLFVELREVVIPDKPLVQLQTAVLRLQEGLVIEGNEAALHPGVVHPEGPSRIELRVVAVLGGCLHVLGKQPLLVLGLEPLVCHLPVTEVLIHVGPAEYDGGNPVLLEHLAAHAAPTGPGIHGGELSLDHRHRENAAHVRGERGRSCCEDPRVGCIAASEKRVHVVHERVSASPAVRPDLGCLHGQELHFHFLPAVSVQVQDGREGRLADEGHHVQPEVVEHEAGTSHGRDKETAPARGEPGHEEAVRAGKIEPARRPTPMFRDCVWEERWRPRSTGPKNLPTS